MYNISSNYQNYINSSFSREPKAKIVVDNVEYTGVVIKSFPQITHETTSFIGGFPAKTCKFEIFDLQNNIDFVGKEVTVYCGLNLGQSIEYIPMGIFKARPDKIISNKTSKVIAFEGTDRTQLFDNTYSSNLVWTSSHTGLEIIQEICTVLGVTLETTTFSFASYTFTSSPNFSSDTTYREVISRMAEIGGEIAFISRTGTLMFKKPTATGVTITKSKYKILKKEKQFGAITRVVLGHNGYDDDIVYGTAGVDWRIEDNPFVDLIRESIIATVAENIIGMSLIPFQLENTIEDYYLDLNDTITIQNKDGTYFTSTILEYKSAGRIKANMKAAVQDGGITNYEIAGSNKKAIKKISLQVDHVNNQITALAEDVNENSESIASLVITAEGLVTTVSQQGTAIGNLSSSVTQTANSVSSIVQSIGSNGTVTSSSIIQSINNNTSTLKISADKIDISGATFPTISNQLSGADLAEITTLYSRSGETQKGIKYTANYHEFNVVRDFTVNSADDIYLKATGGTSNMIRLSCDKDIELIATEDILIQGGAGTISLNATDSEVRISSTSNSIYLDTTGSTTADIRLYSGDMVYIEAVDDVRISSDDEVRISSDGAMTITGPYVTDVLTKITNYSGSTPDSSGCYLEFNYDNATLRASDYLNIQSVNRIYNSCGGRLYLSSDSYLYLSGTRLYWNGTRIDTMF